MAAIPDRQSRRQHPGARPCRRGRAYHVSTHPYAYHRAHPQRLSNQIRHPAPERAGGRARAHCFRTGIPQRGRTARHRRIFTSLAALAFFRGRPHGLVAHRAPAQAGRQQTHGRFRHALALPPQPDRAFLRPAGPGRAANARRAGAAHLGRRPDGRHADSRHQALPRLHGRAPGCCRRLCLSGIAAHAAGGLPACAARLPAGKPAGRPARRACAGPAPGLSG